VTHPTARPPAGRLVLAGLASAALTAALALTARPIRTPHPRPELSPADTAASAPAQPTRRPHVALAEFRSRDPDLTAPPPPRERQVARRFLDVFVRYEVGDVSFTVRRGLRSTAIPRLADELLQAPPRLPDRDMPRPARVLALEARGADATGAEFEALLARRGAPRAVLTLTLETRRGRPYVSALR